MTVIIWNMIISFWKPDNLETFIMETYQFGNKYFGNLAISQLTF